MTGLRAFLRIKRTYLAMAFDHSPRITLELQGLPVLPVPAWVAQGSSKPSCVSATFKLRRFGGVSAAGAAS